LKDLIKTISDYSLIAEEDLKWKHWSIEENILDTYAGKTALSCHTHIINTGVEKMYNI
jgi:hypothetical protein